MERFSLRRVSLLVFLFLASDDTGWSQDSFAITPVDTLFSNTQPLSPVPVVPGADEASLDPFMQINDRLRRLEAENAQLSRRLGLVSDNHAVTRVFRTHINSPLRAGFFGSAEYLRWAYRQPGLEYGITDIGGVQDRGAVGQILQLDSEYDNGLRASMGYRFERGDCNCAFDRPELLFTYTAFDTDLNETRPGSLRATFISADNSENDDSDNINTLGVETITPDDRATSVTASMNFEYDVYDLEFAQTLALTKTLSLRLSGGARAAVLNEDFRVTYTGGDFQVPYRAFRSWDYSGGGILVGTHLNWAPGERFRFRIGAKTGAVLGRYQSRHFFPDDEPGVPTDVRHGETRVNPFVEMSAGLQYERKVGDMLVTLGAGYEIVNWFNMADNRTFTDSHQEGMNVNSVRDLSLDGMFARIGVNY